MVYAYVNIIIDAPDSFAAYREKAGEALSRHGGKVVSASPKQTVLEGEMNAGLGALLGFESAEGAKAWINDPDLAEVHALRNGAGQSTVVLIG